MDAAAAAGREAIHEQRSAIAIRESFSNGDHAIGCWRIVADESRLYDNSKLAEPYHSVVVLTGVEHWFVADLPRWVVRLICSRQSGSMPVAGIVNASYTLCQATSETAPPGDTKTAPLSTRTDAPSLVAVSARSCPRFVHGAVPGWAGAVGKGWSTPLRLLVRLPGRLRRRRRDLQHLDTALLAQSVALAGDRQHVAVVEQPVAMFRNLQ